MIWNWGGNTSGTATSPVQSLPNQIEYFTVVPKVSGTLNVYKISGATQVCIIPLNTALTVGQMWEDTGGTVVLATDQIKIQTNVSMDYDFTFKNLEP